MDPFYEHRTALLQSRREKNTFSFPLHIHDRVEFLYVHSGTLYLNTVGGKHPIRAGALCAVFPYMAHGYDCGGKTVDYSIVIARPADTGEFKVILDSCCPSEPVISAQKLHSDVPRIIEELVKMDYGSVSEEPSFADATLMRSLLQLLLARCIKELNPDANTGEIETNLVVRALSYVSKHFREPITLESVADELETSRYAVSRLFSTRIHTGFLKYVNYLRIEYAKRLLSSTGMNVLEIALESGYENLRTFNRVFKNSCAMSPLRFRKHAFEQASSKKAV